MHEKPTPQLTYSSENPQKIEHAWRPPTQAKEQAIQRVRARLLTQFRRPQVVKEPEHAPGFSQTAWKWIAIGSTAATCLLLLIWATRKNTSPDTWPTLQAQGFAQLQWKKSTHATLQVETPPKHEARLAIRNRWSMTLQGGTKLQVQHKKQKHVDVYLRQGFLQAHVVPGIKQQFVVHCHKNIHVVVKGTRFSVRQERQWLRVEVSRGTVQVRRKKKLLATLEQGQAIRLQFGTLRQQSYSVPITRTPNPGYQFLQLAQNNPRQLLTFARDIRDQKQWDMNKRRETMESIAHLLDGQRKFNEASMTWLLIYRMDVSGSNGQTSLFHAAQSCRRAKQKPDHCVGLYRQWLRKFPQGLSHLHEECLYWHIRSLHKQNKVRALQRAIKRYQTRYPNGVYLSQLQAWFRP